MKKAVVLAVLLAFGLGINVYSDSLARLESSDGNVEVVGCDLTSDNGKDYLVVLLNYENTKGETASPEWQIKVDAYLDGIQLEHGYIYDYEYEGFKDASTEVRPGAVLPYFMLFEMEGNGKIEVEVSPLMNWDNISASCELDLSGTGYVPSETHSDTDSTGGSEILSEPVADNNLSIADLEERIKALEERVSALENQ